VLSTLVENDFASFAANDFERDRLNYRFGFPKPAVIHTENGLAWSAVPDPNVPGTKYNPSHKFLSLAYERSKILATILDRLFPRYSYDVVGDRLTSVHPNAADENEIVDWTLRKFSKLQIKNKMLLLQYSSLGLDTTEVAAKRKLLLGIANELSLKVIDTADMLRNAKENGLWGTMGHHTPLGNELVCSYLFEHGFSKHAVHS